MKKKSLILPIILNFLSLLYSEEVGSLFYEGDICELKDSTITVSEKAVALSSIVKAFPLYIPYHGAPSIVFIIDNSGSMSGSTGNDQWGKRFVFAQELIDSLHYGRMEIGLVIFREHLYFDPADDIRFVQCPGYDTGAYLPLLMKDSSYAPSGETGYQIVKKYLKSDTVGTYVDLQYKPSNIANNSGSANINVGFAAARHALQSSKYPKHRQFIIFLSDGDANECNGPNTSPLDFITDVDNLPTTFTIYFNSTGQVLQNLQDMTSNIQNNGYSSENPSSNMWSIDVDSLWLLLLRKIVIPIVSHLYPQPVNIIISEDTSNVWDTIGNFFTFDDHLPFTGVTTDFSYIVDYILQKDSILPNGDTISVVGDSTKVGNFSVTVDPGTTDPPDWYLHEFEMLHWDRSLGYFYKNTPVSSMNMGMDTLEIRFTEKEIDTLYGYDSVSVTITNTNGNIDSETFNLNKTDSCFTKSFALAVDSTPTQNDGILQLFDSDTVTAVFRNPKLPLDTLELSVPFYPTTSINPNSYNKQKILSLNYINSSILLNLPISGKTKLQVYDINGRLVSTLVDSYKMAGNYKVNWESKRFSSGIYFLKLSVNGSAVSQKFTIIK